jgi:DmsE family decaheme c-type cytochrome
MRGSPRTILALAAGLAFAASAVLLEAQDRPAQEVVSPTTVAPPEGSPAPPAYAEAGVCATCHEEIATALGRTAHGRTERKTWDGGALCESCHGPGAAHVEGGGDKTKIRSFAALSQDKHVGATRGAAPAEADPSAVCLTCHEKGDHSHWKGSQHDGRGLSCLTCHRIHHEKEPTPALLAKATEFETCTSCHLRRKASLYRSGHMPMREGTMSCSSCHNPHGSEGPSMLEQFSVNENCYACHAEKRAPLLWEHPPVKEQCTTCHDPHGSLHPRLLVAKQPRLCQQCHDETRHPTQPYSDASPGAEFFPNSRMFDRGCMNCHSMIHGSNHPAGMRFMR